MKIPNTMPLDVSKKYKLFDFSNKNMLTPIMEQYNFKKQDKQ